MALLPNRYRAAGHRARPRGPWRDIPGRFDGLPPDLQQVVVKAGETASKNVYQFSVDDVNKGRERWKAAGGEVVTLSKEDTAKLKKELSGVGASVTAKNPAEKAMFAILKDAAERTK